MEASARKRQASPSGSVPVPSARRRRDQEVLAAAAKVFHEHGYAEATVQDVAHELGILKGSLYHYIDTKEDLLFRLLMEIHDGGYTILEEVSAASGLGPLARVELYVRRHIAFNLEHLTSGAVYHNDYERLSPERRARIVARRHEHQRFLTGLIRDAQAAGEADPSLDAPIVGSFIHGAVIWPYRWYRADGPMEPAELAEACADFVLNGVIGPGWTDQNQTIG